MPPPITTTSKRSPVTASRASLRESTRLIQVLDDALGGLALGRLALLDRMPEVDQADEALAFGEADCGTALVGAQHLRRSPVTGEPARVRGEQHDVGGARGRVQVL